jgi:hypothetical protein
MRASGCVSVFAIISLLTTVSKTVPAQQLDQITAERILGSEWQSLSRRAGMIFAGTVLSARQEAAAVEGILQDTTQSTFQGTTPAVQLTFRVDEAIAGVEPGQILKVHEWAGAWAMHRPMRTGDRILIFLYTPSRLGLTSPVGGPMGQLALDGSGKNVSRDSRRVSVIQLERAIRSARGE